MSWLPDSGWLRALDLKTSTFGAIALGCWVVFGLAEFDLLYIGVLPAWVRAVFAIVALLALALWLGQIWDLCRARLARWRRKSAILAQLEKLSTSGVTLLRDQLGRNEQTFNISIASPVASGLRRKGLLELSSNLGDLQGGHPHTIPDFVWREMQHRWNVMDQHEERSEDTRSRLRRARAGHRT